MTYIENEEPTQDIEKEKVVATPVKKVLVKPKKEEEKNRWVVVKELPVQVVRESVAEDGTKLHYITTEEAFTQIMNQ